MCSFRFGILINPASYIGCVMNIGAGGNPEKGGGPYNTVLGSDLVYAATPMETIYHCKRAHRSVFAAKPG